MPHETVELLGLLTLGLCAGAIGGLVGLGGSILLIPALTLFFQRDQHTAQAAAMIINVFIAVPACVRHARARAIRWDVAARLLPLGILCVLVGVQVSNHVDGRILQRTFGVFLLYVIFFKIRKLRRDQVGAPVPDPRVGWPVVGLVGGTTGFVAGLLGIGGGPISVPLLQRVCHLPLRLSIGGSAALMCLTALVGAITKNATLEGLTNAHGQSLGLRLEDSLAIAGLMAPPALVGALYGAGWTHALPLRWVRVAFLLLLAWASVLMLGFG